MVFVTGGSGFIGGRLIERLIADGHSVRGLARSDHAAARISERGGEPVRGDLSDVEAMRSGAAGCELAFHAAAMLGDWGRREDFERANVERHAKCPGGVRGGWRSPFRSCGDGGGAARR